jgi:hypothetical protein
MRSKFRTMLVALGAVLALSALTAASALASGSPSVETKPATNITETGATLNGVVNPNGAATKYYFEYGTTTGYGKKTAEVSAGSGTKNLEESAAITGLTINITYHFRIVATSTNGTSDGADKEFVATPKTGPEFVPAKGVAFPIAVEGAIKSSSESISFAAEDGLTPSVCEGVKVKGEITGAKAASLTADFEGCHEHRLTAETCHSVGAASGVIVTSGSGSLVYLNKATKQVGVVLSVSEVNIECKGGIIWKLKGTVISPITPINTETTKYELRYRAKSDGIEEFTSYENEKGGQTNTELKVSLGSGWASVSLEEGEALKLTASKSLEISA